MVVGLEQVDAASLELVGTPEGRFDLISAFSAGCQTVFSLTVQAENGPHFCLVARFTHFERSAQRDRALSSKRFFERV
jgi:hypothetical protein